MNLSVITFHSSTPWKVAPENFLSHTPDRVSTQVSHKIARTLALGSAVLLLSSVLMGASAQAQVINDPAASMIYRMPSRFQPITPTEVKREKEEERSLKKEQPLPAASSVAPQAASPAKSDTSGTVQTKIPNKMMDRTPSSSSLPASQATDAAPAVNASGAPIQARAVMVDINSNTLNYDKDHDVYVATGSVHMIISEQNSELYTDKLTYDQNQDLAIAEGNVVIIKNGQRTEGTYAKIDLTRKSALINDTATVISAVKVKAKQSFVNNNEIQMENGRLIISGVMFQRLAMQGGLSNLSQSTGKGSNQARLKREYSKKVFQNRSLFNQLTIDQQETLNKLQTFDASKDNFSESPDKLSRFSMKARDIEIVRHKDGYDDITLHHPSLYAGKHKLFNMPDTDFSYDNGAKSFQYLGPDVGSNRAYGGAYAGPGWDFHLGRGSLRVSPFASYGSPGFWSSNGKDGKQISNGLGVGGIMHYRDPDTTVDVAYNSHVGSPILFADRRIYGDSVHLMVSHNDIYQNGLLGQNERPTYIAQLTDYRVLKQFSKFQLSSFESLGYAKDNFYPNFRESYFISSQGKSPQTLGRAQFQLQLQNTSPLFRFGKYAAVGMRAQLLTSAYTSSDYVALGRIGPTLNLNLLGNRLQSSLGYTLSHSIGKSPFVFDSYYGGAQNVSMNNLFRINKYMSIGNSGSFSLNRDNAKKALAVGNMFYMMVGPTDLKATIGYDFINSRSYFGFNYYPGPSNTVVNFDKMRVTQPTDYTQSGGAGSRF